MRPQDTRAHGAYTQGGGRQGAARQVDGPLRTRSLVNVHTRAGVHTLAHTLTPLLLNARRAEGGKARRARWTAEEDAALKAHFPAYSQMDSVGDILASFLEGRTPRQVCIHSRFYVHPY